MSKPADTDKPLLEAIAKRWSPRAFAEREPTDAELELVFEAARWAASCFNDQPWRYIVVRRTEPEFADALAGLGAAPLMYGFGGGAVGLCLRRSPVGVGLRCARSLLAGCVRHDLPVRGFPRRLRFTRSLLRPRFFAVAAFLLPAFLAPAFFLRPVFFFPCFALMFASFRRSTASPSAVVAVAAALGAAAGETDVGRLGSLGCTAAIVGLASFASSRSSSASARWWRVRAALMHSSRSAGASSSSQRWTPIS